MTDQQFLKFLRNRNNELEERYKREVPMPKGLGLIVKGTVFDINRKSFERALKDLDPELFLVWNPYKNEGLGSWQVWIKPTSKRVIKQTEEIYTLEYKYVPIEHHVYDLPHLSYDFIAKLREMRTTLQEINTKTTKQDVIKKRKDKVI
jgi:hypothetical protein